ncbi:MAG: YcxB family protein [Candidatus Melainabacteria bacterium]|nr:YcxB family protein [Candidatus Melainabacteria bacterium]
MMMTPDEPRFEVEINYTKPIIKSMVFELNKPLYKIFGLLLLLSMVCFLFPDASSIFSLGRSFWVGSIVYCISFPVVFLLFLVKQLKNSLARFGWGKKLTLTSEHFSWQWENKVITTAPWQTFYCLQKRKHLWLLYLDKALILYLPTDQLPAEAQAFILQKLTEYNVPIKG